MNAAESPETDPRTTTEAEPAFWLAPLQRATESRRLAQLIVLMLGALIFLPRLGSMGLWDPWETHYGEVAREMIVRDDYVFPHWESAYFFSKPPLAMWLMAVGMQVFGAEAAPIGQALGSWTEWGVRLPFAFIAIGAMWAVYRIGRQLRDDATGVLAAIVLGGSAQFIFIGKQSMVDMPLVGCMTIGLALFCAAVFDPEVEEEAKAKKLAPRWMRQVGTLGIALCTFPQFFAIARELGFLGNLAMLPAFASAGLLAFVIYTRGTRQWCLLGNFYALVGMAALAKGPAVLLALGPVPVLYILFTLDWRVLVRGWVAPGIWIFLVVAVPWFLALSLFDGRDDEGKTFVARFWIHDTFNRLGRGVHGDRPTIGYYLEQLAYGMWPWSALAPFAIGLAARMKKAEIGDHRRRLLTFVLVWGLWSYVAFSLSRTGFHHYIFPAVPPLALLVGYWIRWVADAPKERIGGFVALPILAIALVGIRDLINDPQHISSLFTYKYDRAYPREVRRGAIQFLSVLGIVGFAGLLAVLLAWTHPLERFRRHIHGYGMLVFGAVGVMFAAWISHYHFNYLAQHWSQAHMFKTYFDEKKGDEPIYAYQLNWRGETFYSRNTVIQVKESGANQRMRELVERPGREFIVVEQSRFNTLKSVLPADKRDSVRILDKSAVKFYLLVVE